MGEAWGGGPWRAGKGGDGGGGHQRAVWEQQKCIGSPFWAPLKPNNRSDLAGDEGGGMGGGVGRWPMEGGQGGRWGGGTREQCGSNKRCTGSPVLGSLKNLTTGLIWLVTRVGGWGEAWGGGPWRAGKGGDGGRWPMDGRARGEMGGGHQKTVWEQQKVHWFPFFGLP